MEDTFKAPDTQALQAYLPAKIFADKMDPEPRLQENPTLRFGTAHYSGEAVVFFPARKLAFAGDRVKAAPPGG
jgi:hypothetical protein